MLSIQIPFYNLVLLAFSLFTYIQVEIITSPANARRRIISLQHSGKKIGFVPTMGALHAGHEKLIESSVNECDTTVASIFVNHAQFNNLRDYEKYPKTLEADVSRLEETGCDILFAPSAEEMYPQLPKVTISFPSLQKVMEARHRPGHFEGVALVVAKLFHAVPAHRAYFGQKDWQQFLIIRQLVADLCFDITVKPVATVRESTGLAMSSRNLRLSADGLKKASVFYRSLKLAQKALLAGTGVKEVTEMVKKEINAVGGVKLEYFEVANNETLELLERVEGDESTASLFIAGYIEDIRLIDNIFLKEETYQ